MEVKTHAEQMSDGMDLINATGTKAPDIEFLERHHIGLASGDHLSDPPWVCSSVCADASVDVVSHDAQRSWPWTLVPAVDWIHRLLQYMLAHLGVQNLRPFLELFLVYGGDVRDGSLSKLPSPKNAPGTLEIWAVARHNHTSTICGSSSGGRFNWIKLRYRLRKTYRTSLSDLELIDSLLGP
jgi:hypothetical protein